MRLTVYSDYSLRLLMYLAARPERLSTIPEVAKSYGISVNHLMKVAHQLGQAGYLETVRGRGGGMRLGKPAAEIILGAVLRHTEPDMDIVPCFQPDNEDCPLRRACALKIALQRARQAFLDVLDEYSIGDLVTVPGTLRSLLGLAASEA
jgi:Rrf2 family transcriptional regulator, nitric oxide-sensitive transcriptional repressor